MKRTKLILVDDNPGELFFMEKGFRESRLYTVIGKFSNAAELKEGLNRHRELPGVLVTDLNMPGQSGLQLAAEIKSNPAYASIQVVVLSIADAFDLEMDFNGIALLLPKPKSLLGYKAFATYLHEKILAGLLRGNG